MTGKTIKLFQKLETETSDGEMFSIFSSIFMETFVSCHPKS